MNNTPEHLLSACLKAKRARAHYLATYFRAHGEDLQKNCWELDRFLNEQIDLDTEIDILEYEIERRLIEKRKERESK